MLRSSQVLFPPKREAFLKRGGFCSQRSVSEQLPILPHTPSGLRRRLARGRSKTSLPVAALEGKEAQIPLKQGRVQSLLTSAATFSTGCQESTSMKAPENLPGGAEVDAVNQTGIPADWLADFEAAAGRPLETRFRYAFIRTYKPVLDDAPFRAFQTTADYRRWCEENLPDWLGYGRV